jgi:hypothetical protein
MLGPLSMSSAFAYSQLHFLIAQLSSHEGISQSPANTTCGPNPFPVFMNKVLLELSHSHSLTYFLMLLLC